MDPASRLSLGDVDLRRIISSTSEPIQSKLTIGSITFAFIKNLNELTLHSIANVPEQHGTSRDVPRRVAILSLDRLAADGYYLIE
jgi:hypothetical protein